MDKSKKEKKMKELEKLIVKYADLVDVLEEAEYLTCRCYLKGFCLMINNEKNISVLRYGIDKNSELLQSVEFSTLEDFEKYLKLL